MKTHRFILFCLRSSLACLLISFFISCDKQQKPAHISAQIIKNDVFKGYAISDQEYIEIEAALRLLFKDAPLQANSIDSIVQTIHNNKVFKAETNFVSLMFKGGIIKDSVAISLQRDLSAFKRRAYLIESPDNMQYTTLCNTKDVCTIKATEMISTGKRVAVGINNGKIYHLDTISGNFYDDKHNILANVKGIRSYSASGIYKVSYTIYNGKKPNAAKSIVYDTTKHNTDLDIPRSIRSGI